MSPTAHRETVNNGTSGSASRYVGREGQRRRAARETTVPIRESRPLRFFLETSDAVVDAPSIGPKTAEKLHEIGIRTVADLLDADADASSQELGDRRIDAKTIRTWQVQARLVCRIPNLRGHDAQILVACDIMDPQSLAEQDADHLYEQVKQFVHSSEGKRVLRNGKRPDQAEVAAWIEWAESARQLRAA